MVLPEPPVKVASKPPVRVVLSIVRLESVACVPPLAGGNAERIECAGIGDRERVMLRGAEAGGRRAA